MQIDPRQVKWDAEPSIDVSAVKWDEPAPGNGSKRDAALVANNPMVQKAMNYDATDARGGQLRGAGSIGATLLAPIDALARLANNGKPINVGGYDIAGHDRRAGMDAGLQSMGVNTDSTQFKTNKLIGEVAGTSGVGGAIAKGIAAIPGAAKALPTLLPAIQSGGMVAPGATGAAGLAARAAGGAVTGAATAGLVNPEDAAGGALIGGAFPLVVKGMGALGGKMPKPSKALTPNPTRLATAREGIDAGYVLPPATLRPTFSNRVLESWSGKDATKQLVSVKNSEVTEGLVRKALGITDETIPLTQSTMENLRKTAGKAYADVSALSPQAAQDLEALKLARNEAQAWFNSYNRSANPEHLATAKQFRAQAEALETALEGHAKAANKSELIGALRDARKKIAKTYTVGRALNSAAGTVDAKVLARLSEKGAPLSDGLDTVGRFASAFPTAVLPPTQIGSPGVSKLSAGASTLLGGGGFAALGPAGAAAAAIPFVVPPVARARLFSNSVQKGLITPRGTGAVRGLLNEAGDEALPLLHRSSGLLAGY